MLQRGHFTIPTILELPKLTPDENGLSKVIELDYMGHYEFEGNSVPLSRLFIEFYKEFYEFYPINIFNASNSQMFIYANAIQIDSNDPEFLQKIAERQIDRNYSLYEHIKHPKNAVADFWWDINGDYFIFFGEEKKEIIEYFINSCYTRDGGKEKIKAKIHQAGYKLKDE